MGRDVAVDREVLRRFLRLDPGRRRQALETLSDEDRAWLATAIKYDWSLHERPEQALPDGAWDIFVMLAGRGGGKTRPAAQTVVRWQEDYPLIALMAKDAAMVRDVMIEGNSGILACCPPWLRSSVKYDRGKLKLTWPNGAVCLPMTAEAGADAARGRQFHKAWAEEVAAWPHVAEAWHEGLMNALRLGVEPQVVVTTTPKPTEFINTLCLGPKDGQGRRPVPISATQLGSDGTARWEFSLAAAGVRPTRTVVSRWITDRNAENLAPGFAEKRRQQYGEGSSLASQELDADILAAADDALWSQAILEGCRVRSHPASIERMVVAVDPTRSESMPKDEAGIIVACRCKDGHVYVLQDATLRAVPWEWATRALELAAGRKADAILYEENRLDERVKNTMRVVAESGSHRWEPWRSTLDKKARAEPVSALYRAGRVHHVGAGDEFMALEHELTTWSPASRWSPNRMDALVLAVTDLLLGKPRAVIAGPSVVGAGTAAPGWRR